MPRALSFLPEPSTTQFFRCLDRPQSQGLQAVAEKKKDVNKQIKQTSQTSL